MEGKERPVVPSPQLARLSRDGDVEDFYPLSPTQSGLLFHSLYAPEAGVYFEQHRSTIEGSLDTAAFLQAWQLAAERNAVLRTAFVWEGLEQPVQIVTRRVEIACQILDWRAFSRTEHEGRLDSFLRSDRAEGLDPRAAPLMRLTLIRLDENEWRLVWSHHHLILDASSLGLLLDEVMDLYDRLVRGEPLPEGSRRPYRDYVLWLEKQDRAAAEAFWRDTLSGFTAPTTLPLPRFPSSVPDAAEGREELVLSTDLTASLEEFARRNHLSLETLAQGAFGIMLRRYCGEDDVVFGTIASGRSADLPGSERMVGLFLNAVPLRVRISGSDQVLPLLGRIDQARRSLEPFAHSSLLDLQRWSLLGRETPLFENLLVFESGIEERLWGEGSGGCVRLRNVRLYERAKYPITLIVTAGPRLKLELLWNGRRLEPGAARRMAAHIARLLEEMTAAPHLRLADLSFLSEAERHQLSFEWAAVEDHPVDTCLHERFEAQVAARRDAVALVDEGEQLTYGCLNARANQIAHHLNSLGIGCESKVAICLERSAELVVSILGVLKAGAAYVPLDPNYPRERLEFMLRDVGASALLSHHRLRERLPADHATVLIDLDAEGALMARRDDRNRGVPSYPDQLAYVIYTSGSTGTPKGVEITHANVMRLFQSTEENFRFGGEDVWTLFHSYAFDFSVWELFGALLYGGRLVVVPYLTSRSPELFDELLRRERVSVLNQTPSAFRSLVTHPGSRPPDDTDLRWVIFGGEALDFGLVETWLGRPGNRPRLVNMYGITETTVHVTYRPLEPEHAASSGSRIGVPISDLAISLLDRDANLVPLCVPGEIHVGGAGLARGYRNRPRTTAERFVPHPAGSSPGARLYRTGDWARYWPDRDLEYLGRMDQQVKVRGFRVELGEIEAALEEHPSVRQCAVVVRGDSPDERRIVAYVVGDGSSAAASELRLHLQKKLPEHMVPAVFAFVDGLPLTPSGKLDTKALPAPDGARRQVEDDYVAPRNPTEVALAHVWQEVLGLDRVGVHDNFFALGGDSILSIQMVARSGARGLNLTPRQIFQFPTIAELAPIVGQGARISTDQAPVTGTVELTPVQRWYLEIEREPRHFNQALLLDVTHGLDPSVIRETLAELLVHHDALRLRLVREGPAFRLDNQGLEAAQVRGVFVHVDLTSLSEAEGRRAVEEISARLQESLAPTAAPLIRAAWFDLASSSHRLLLAAHHLAVDGISWRILLEDMFSAYEQRRRGRPALLAAKTTSFQSWSKRLKEYARTESVKAEVGYWTEVVSGNSGRLPLDTAEGDNICGSADTVAVSLNRHETRALLQGVPAAYRTQINDVLLSALSLTLTEWCGSDSVLVDLEGHGREDLFDDVDVSRTVGWFTTIYPVRLSPGDRGAPGAVLKRVKEDLRRVPRGGIGYGLLRYLPDDTEPTGLPVEAAEASFNYLGQLDVFLAGRVPVQVASESIGPTLSLDGRRTHLLEITGAVRDGELQFGWTYSRNRHSRATIENRASSFVEILRELVHHCQQPESGGVTPSDFPLAPLLQDELDELVGTGREVEDLYPLTPVQRGILVQSIGAPGAGPYFEQFCWGVEGTFTPELMRRAWERLVRRHSVFRTAFRWEASTRPVQIVYRNARLAWQYQDWRDDSPEGQDARLRRFLEEDRGLAFDLARPPLLRVALIRLAESRWYLAWSHHRLILDAWSVDLLWNELVHSCEELRRDQTVRLEKSRPYRDFVAWLDKQELSEAEAFWRGALRDFEAPARLGLESPRDVSTTTGEPYRRDRAAMTEADASALQQLARRHGLPVETLARAAFAVLLSRYTRESDVLFGTTVDGRSAPVGGIESMLGLFMNVLPLRLRPRSDRSTIRWLQEVQSHFAEVLRHQHTPLAEARRWSGLRREAGVPFLESLVALESRPHEPSRLQARLTRWSISSHQRTSFPITLFVDPRRTWSLEIAYDARRYDEASMTRMLGHLQCLLRGIAADGEGSLSELSLLTPAERRQLLDSFGSAVPDGPLADRILEEPSLRSKPGLFILDPELEPVPVGLPGEIHATEAADLPLDGTPEAAAESSRPNPFSRAPGARLRRTGELGCLGRNGTITQWQRAGSLSSHPAEEPTLARGYVAPRTQTETELSRIWAQVLGVDPVGIFDDFFELGGDSAASLSVAAHARRVGLHIAPGHLFESPTISDLSRVVSELDKAASERVAIAEPAPVTAVRHGREEEPSGLAGLDAGTEESASRAVRADGRAGLPASIEGEVEDIYPLSPMQSGLLFHSLYAPHSNAYFDQHSCTLEGSFDRRLFMEAWRRTCDRHAILRTCFAWEGLDQPMQIVRPAGELPWSEQDWRNLPSDLQNERLESLLHADRMLGFDFKRAPLMRMSLIRLSETSWNLLWSHHHLLLDGWSVPLLLGEVMLLYESSLRGQSLDLGAAVPYRSYIDWLKTQDLGAAETFWRKTLAGFAEATPLKMGEISPGAIAGGEAQGEADILLSRDLTSALERFARRERTTANTVVQGAWALLLSRYSGREDVLFGATVSGRSAPLPGIETAVGLFINAVPVRVHVRPTARLSAWLNELQERQSEARQYEYAPLAEVQAWSDVPQGAPLFESLLAFENFPIDRRLQEHQGTLRIRDVRVYDRTNYPLTLVIVPAAELLLLRANYDRHRFTDSSMKRMLGRLSRLIENIVSRPDGLLEEVQVDTELEIGSAPPILPSRPPVRGSELSGSSRGG
jgi:amino acid adenylation domain-containing protein/non-ribosomal peptide synthase protein (TIGR01720 family)